MAYGPYKRTDRPTDFPDGMPVALEYDGDRLPAIVGKIAAVFAAIERHLPEVVARVSGMTMADAVAVCATFRSFSSRLDILGALLSNREPSSHDRIVYTHCKGLFKEASSIRNKYLHALYSKGHEMRFSPFHHDYKRPDNWRPMEPEVTNDKRRISFILGELFAIIHQKQLPPAVYDRLREEDR